MRRALLAAAALVVVGAFGMVLLPMLLLTTYSGMGATESVAACGDAPASNDIVPVAVNAGSGPGPGGISAEDWAKVQTYAGAKQIDPLVLVAIGMHETDWGRLGDGRNGNILGVGSYDGGSTYRYAGIDNQLAEGSSLLAGWGVHTIGDLVAGKAAAWATDPGWESAVAGWYSRLGGTGQAVTSTVTCPAASLAAAVTGADPGPGPQGADHLTPRMIALKAAVKVQFPQFTDVGCWRASDPYPDHPSGRACDFMVPGLGHDQAGVDLGNQLADWVQANAKAFGLQYEIFRQRYRPAGTDWAPMTDRGGWTANHMDHVHVTVLP
jgi:hypothetical protein